MALHETSPAISQSRGWDSWLYIYAIASRSHILANSSSCLDEPPTRRVGAANTARLQSRQHGAAPDSYNSRPLVKYQKSLPFCTGGLVLTRLDPPHTTVRRHTRLSQRYTALNNVRPSTSTDDKSEHQSMLTYAMAHSHVAAPARGRLLGLRRQIGRH